MTRSIAGRHRTGRLVAASAGIAAIFATASLAACSAGQIAETSLIVPAVPGGSTVVTVPNPGDANSAILLQNVTIGYSSPAGYPAGGNAPVSLRIVNQTTDVIMVTPGVATLTGPTAANGTSTALGTLSWTDGSAPTLLTATAPSPSSAPAGPSSPVPTSSGSSVPSAPAAPSAPAIADITIQPASIAILQPSGNPGPQYLQIANLSQVLKPGDTVNLTFTFTDTTTHATYTATVAAPVAPPPSPAPRESIGVSPNP